MNRTISSAAALAVAGAALAVGTAIPASAQSSLRSATAQNTHQPVTAPPAPAGPHCGIRARITGDWVRIRNGAGGPVMGYAFRSDSVSAPIYNGGWPNIPGWYNINDYSQGLLGSISSQYVAVYNSCIS